MKHVSIANQKCGYCPELLGTRNIHYQNGVFSHKQCWEKKRLEDEERAEIMAARFGFGDGSLYGFAQWPAGDP